MPDIAKRVLDAVREMTVDAAARRGCASGMCAPRIVLRHRDPRFPDSIVCRRDPQSNDQTKRVVVLLVEQLVGGDLKPELNDIQLSNTVASLEWLFDKPRKADVEFSVTAIGGHYYGLGRTYTDRAKVVVPLRLRCRDHDVQIPAVAGPPDMRVDVTIRSGAHEVLCTGMRLDDDRRTLRVPLPHREGRKTITIDVGTPRDAYYTRLAAHWNTVEPPPVVVTQVEAVSFRWKRHCLYPKVAECPTARIPDVGIECAEPSALASDAHSSECAYVCERAPGADPASEAHVSFTLPVRLSFQRKLRGLRANDDVWEDVLSYSDQLLSGYVKAEDRYLDLSFDRWIPSEAAAKGGPDAQSALTARRWRSGDEISSVSITSPMGRVYTVTPQLGQRIPAPGVTCDEVLKYQIVGTRPYEESTVPISDGRIDLPHPTTSASRFAPGLKLLVGGLIRFYSPSADRSPHGQVLTGLQVIGSLRPKAWPVALELRAGYMLGQQAYYTLAGALGTTLYHRWPLGVLVRWNFKEDFYAGVGPQLILAHNSSESNGDNVERFQPYGSFEAVVGYVFPGRYVSIEAGVMLSALEKVHAYEAPDYWGRSQRTMLRPFGLFPEVAVVFGRR